ncbi:DinB family protein [Paenibacillus sp. GCM10027627]|uniref:DinB family protein n=1 Tax=unclassified Paenibacillus TaxID=185978 RepID=UPI003632E685
MYLSIEAFIEDYRTESMFTEKLLRLLTNESLSQGIAEGCRELGALAWHLIPPMGLLGPTGLHFQVPPEPNEAALTASAIADAYSATAAALMDAVTAQWTDETLHEEVDIYGYTWKNGYTLALFVKHEIHHRGQLTVLMRQAGLPLIGIYGPTKEEWLAMSANG